MSRDESCLSPGLFYRLHGARGPGDRYRSGRGGERRTEFSPVVPNRRQEVEGSVDPVGRDTRDSWSTPEGSVTGDKEDYRTCSRSRVGDEGRGVGVRDWGRSALRPSVGLCDVGSCERGSTGLWEVRVSSSGDSYRNRK